jgi:hypothetical protein
MAKLVMIDHLGNSSDTYLVVNNIFIHNCQVHEHWLGCHILLHGTHSFVKLCKEETCVMSIKKEDPQKNKFECCKP